MIKNIGSTDKMIRLIVGGLFLLIAILFKGGIILGLLGVILLATALMGTCPLYIPFKFTTKK